MEALLIINSALVAIGLYFVKDFHTDFKEVSKKVTQLDQKVDNVHEKLNDHVDECKTKIRRVK